MKTRIPRSIKNLTSLAVLAIAVNAVTVDAIAKPVSPAGASADAALPGAVATTGAAPMPVVAQAPGARKAPAVAAKPAAPPVEKIVKEVKAWVKEQKAWAESQWKSLQGFWGAPAAAPGKPAQGVAKAPAGAPTQVPGQASRSANVPPQGMQPALSQPQQHAAGVAVAAGVASVLPAVPSLPVAPPPPPARKIEEVGGRRTAQGVPVYEIKKTDSIPRIDVGREDRIKSSHYYVEGKDRKTFEDRIIHPFWTPDTIVDKQMKELTMVPAFTPADLQKVKDVEFQPKGRVSRETFDRIVMNLKNEPGLALMKFDPLSAEDMRFLAGLLLFQQGDKCASAVGLFHSLPRKEWGTEADYYLALCSRSLGLESDFIERARRVLESGDTYFARKIMPELKPAVPNELIEPLGAALHKAVMNRKTIEGLDAKTVGTVAYLLSLYGTQTGDYKTTINWARQVPETHPKHLESQFLLALAEYQSGSKDTALKIQETLVGNIKTEKAKDEFQALVALNAARMFFQEKQFKKAQMSFLKVAKDHPLWLQSLTELGWSQLMSGDYEGAIGNMYSIQSPYFSAVFKPESYVIRTIGYLNLCQYGDAYRMLSILEHDYRPQAEAIDRFIDSAGGKPGVHYQAVRTLLSQRDAKTIEGLPATVVREMARHRDFLNLQNALNREIDERQIYGRLDAEIEKSLKQAQFLGESSRRRLAELKRNIDSIARNPQLESNRNQWLAQLGNETRTQDELEFMEFLFGNAKKSLPAYMKEMTGSSDGRVAKLKTRVEKTLASRLLKMREDLARVLENNELLRYEVFAGSGENIRFQVAGGEKGNRVPASAVPKSKSLQWAFDGEYWEDEIGHYRSSLKNNCPDSQRSQARLEGGAQ